MNLLRLLFSFSFILFFSFIAQAQQAHGCRTEHAQDLFQVRQHIINDWHRFDEHIQWKTKFQGYQQLERMYQKRKVGCFYGEFLNQSQDIIAHTNTNAAFFSAKIVSILQKNRKRPRKLIQVHGTHFQKTENFSQENRQACLAGLLTETFVLSKKNNRRRAKKIGKAAFDYWKEEFNADIQYSACQIIVQSN